MSPQFLATYRQRSNEDDEEIRQHPVLGQPALPHGSAADARGVEGLLPRVRSSTQRLERGGNDASPMPGLTPAISMNDGEGANARDEENLASRNSPEAPTVEYSDRMDYGIMAVLEGREVFFKVSIFVESDGRGSRRPAVLVQMLDTLPLGSDRTSAVQSAVAMELQQGLVRALRLATVSL